MPMVQSNVLSSWPDGRQLALMVARTTCKPDRFSGDKEFGRPSVLFRADKKSRLYKLASLGLAFLHPFTHSGTSLTAALLSVVLF